MPRTSIGLIISFVLITCSCSVECVAEIENNYIIIETEMGRIRGTIERSKFYNETRYYSFRGIPFAQPPLGDLRFKAPVPVEPWAPEVWNATHYRPACIQSPNPATTYGISEDCLFLNIYVPIDVAEETGLATMMFICGGGYRTGSGDDARAGPDFLMEKGVIFATMNHRLGILGFLTLHNKEISGNQGLKDQQMSLKWLHTHIHNFGGNPNRISLVGSSSGGCSADLHVFNTDSAQYLHNYILISSAVTMPAFPVDIVIDQLYDHTSSNPANNCTDLVKFLREMPAIELYEAVKPGSNAGRPFINWGPTIESEDVEGAFLTKSAWKLYEDSYRFTLPGFYMFANREHAGTVGRRTVDVSTIHQLMNSYACDPPFGLDGIYIKESELPTLQRLLQDALDLFTANATTDFELTADYIELNSYMDVVYFIVKEVMVRLQYPNLETFILKYEMDTSLNAAKRFHNVTFPGATHGDMLCYFLWWEMDADYYKRVLATRDTDEQSKSSLRSIEYASSMISNFVKYSKPVWNGYPTPVFDPVKPGALKYLQIDNDGLRFDEEIDEDSFNYIDELVSEIRRLIDVDKTNQLRNTPCDRRPNEELTPSSFGVVCQASAKTILIIVLFYTLSIL